MITVAWFPGSTVARAEMIWVALSFNVPPEVPGKMLFAQSDELVIGLPDHRVPLSVVLPAHAAKDHVGQILSHRRN